MTRLIRLTCASAGAAIVAGVMAGDTPTAAQQKPAADTALEVIQIRPQFYVIAGG